MANNFLSPYAAAYGGCSPQLSPRGPSPEPGQAYGAWYNDPVQMYQHPAAALDPYMACRGVSPNHLSPDPSLMHPQHSPIFQGPHFAPNAMDFYGAFPLNNNYAWNINNNTIVYTDDEEINTNAPGLFYSASAQPPPHQVVPPAHDTPRARAASTLPKSPSGPFQQQQQQPQITLQQPPRASLRQMQRLTLPSPQARLKRQTANKQEEENANLVQPEEKPESGSSKKNRKQAHKQGKQAKETLTPTDNTAAVSPSAVSAGSAGSEGSGGGKGGGGSSSGGSNGGSRLSISPSQGQLTRSNTSGSIRKKSKPSKINLTRYRGSERLPFAAVGMRRAWQMEVTTGAIFLVVGAICVLVDLSDDYALGSMFVGWGLAAFGVVFIVTGLVWRDQISRKKARRAGSPGATPYSELRNQAVTPTTPSKEFSDGLITP